MRVRQTEGREQAQQSGLHGGRRVLAREFRLRDGQLEPLHVVRDAPQFLHVQPLVPGQYHAVKLGVGRTERQYHVIANRFPDVHRARKLIVVRHHH